MKTLVCTGKSCSSNFSKYIMIRIQNDIKFFDWKNIELAESLCMGNCKKGPNISLNGEIYNYVNPIKASEIISKKIQEAKKRLQQQNNSTKKKK